MVTNIILNFDKERHRIIKTRSHRRIHLFTDELRRTIKTFATLATKAARLLIARLLIEKVDIDMSTP